jgi:hypothetical protein
LVALNVHRGVCYGLSDVGAQIWRLIANPIRVSDLCAALRDDYAVDSKTCEADVIEFLEDLIDEGVVAVVPDAAGA